MKFEIRANQEWGPILSNKATIVAIKQLSNDFTKIHKASGKTGIELYFTAWIENQIDEIKDHGVLAAILLLRESNEPIFTWDGNINNAKEIEKFLNKEYLNKDMPKDLSWDLNEINLDTKDIIRGDKYLIAKHPDKKNRKFILNDINKKIIIYKLSLEESFSNDCALAIALHNYHKALNDKNKKDRLMEEIGPLDIKNFPLAFLLAYCDSSQEWGRRSTKEMYFIDYSNTDVDLVFNEISFNLAYDIVTFRQIMEKKGKNFLNDSKAQDGLFEKVEEEFDKMKNTWKSKELDFCISVNIIKKSKDAITNKYVYLGPYGNRKMFLAEK